MKLNKNILLIIVMLIVSGSVSWFSFFSQYTQRDTVNIHLFPKTVGEWTATEIPISDNDYEILETRNAFSRIYRSPGREEVMLFIVYSQSNRKVSHPPEICYTGGGATILNKTAARLDMGPGMTPIEANRFASEQGNYDQMTYYWFKVGTSFTASYSQQQILIALKTLLFQPSSSAMIRLSTAVADEKDTARADATAAKFAKEILPLVKQYLP